MTIKQKREIIAAVSALLEKMIHVEDDIPTITVSKPALPEMLTVKELCIYLGIDRSTFYKTRIAEQLRPYKVGKRIKYKKSDAERLRIGR